MAETIYTLHEKALALAKDYKTVESSLLEILIRLDSKKAYLALGYPSLFKYCVDALRLTESQTYTFISVARKSKSVPELKEKVRDGSISISNARRISSVINAENKTLWLEKASTLSEKELEKEIVKENPKQATKETIRPVQANRSELKLGITDELEKKLIRVKDILSQKLQLPCSMEQALDVMVDEYLKRHDPLLKATTVLAHSCHSPRDKTQSNNQPLSTRPLSKNTLKKSDSRLTSTQHTQVHNQPLSTRPQAQVQKPVRARLPAYVKHQVNFRDNAQCTFLYPNGTRCQERRWVHFHHIRPLADGGTNRVENIKVLCSSHHAFMHHIGA